MQIRNVVLSLFLSVGLIHCTEDKNHEDFSFIRGRNVIDFRNDLVTMSQRGQNGVIHSADSEVEDDVIEDVIRYINRPAQFKGLAARSRDPEKLCWGYFKKIYTERNHSLNNKDEIRQAQDCFQKNVFALQDMYQYETLLLQNPVRKALSISPALYDYVGHPLPFEVEMLDSKESYGYFAFQKIDGLTRIYHDQLVNLQSFSLSANKLEAMPEDFLNGFKSLMELNLANNRLTSLPRGFFNESHNLCKVRLEGNDFSDEEKIRIQAELEALGVEEITI